MKIASILIPTLALSALSYALILLAIDVQLNSVQMSVVVVIAFAIVMLVRKLLSWLSKTANKADPEKGGDARDVESQ